MLRVHIDLHPRGAPEAIRQGTLEIWNDTTHPDHPTEPHAETLPQRVRQ